MRCQAPDRSGCPLPRPRRAASPAVLGVAAGRNTLFTPARLAEAVRTGIGLCGSNCRLPDPGLRRAPCSALSGLSSRSVETKQATALPPSHGKYISAMARLGARDTRTPLPWRGRGVSGSGCGEVRRFAGRTAWPYALRCGPRSAWRGSGAAPWRSRRWAAPHSAAAVGVAVAQRRTTPRRLRPRSPPTFSPSKSWPGRTPLALRPPGY